MAAKSLKNLFIIVTVFLFLLFVPELKIDTLAAGNDISSEYKIVAESDTYELYVYEPTLSIILKNKQTGALIRSTLSEEENDQVNNKTWTAYMQSGIVLSAIKGQVDTYQVDLIQNPNTIEYTYESNGFSAKIFFSEYEFGLTVNVTLEGDELVVNVPEESIVENSEKGYIGTVSLFPFMGYTYLDSQEGYMFVPDGNGALIYLDDKDGKYTTGFSQMIYGKDVGFTDSSTETLLWEKYQTVNSSYKVMAPVFGMMHVGDALGYLAVVEEGDTRASIEAHPNGVMVNYNRCFAKFLVRRIYVQPLNNSNSGTTISVESDRTHTNLKVRYLLLSEENADYSGMAVAYRNYLLENGQVSVQDTTYNTRVDFLGSDREEFLMLTKAVPMTTTEQIREMYGEFKAAGIESLLTIYKGWQQGGLYNIPITKYKADSKIGGTSEVTSLIQDAAEDSYQIYLYNEALQANPSESNTTFNAVKMVNKRRLEINTRDYVYQIFNYLLPTKTSDILSKFAKSYTNKDVSNLVVAGITDNLFSYSYNGKYYSRLDCANTYTSTITALNESTNLILETPFSYLWNQTNAFLDMPMGTSDYMYEDEEIPFFSMVLKGILPMYADYANFEANKQEFYLEMVESGCYPSFYLTYEDSSDLIYTNSADLYSTKYEIYKDMIVEYDAQFRALANQTQGAMIINHAKLQTGVNKVTYDNGVVIYVNYTDVAVTVDGYTVEALSYKVGEAG